MRKAVARCAESLRPTPAGGDGSTDPAGARLRRSLAGRSSILCAPGVFDTLSTLLAERAGFEAAFLSGSALAWSRLGRPDVGLLGGVELVDVLSHIAERCALPLLVDADSGFGNALQVARIVRMLEATGAAAIQIEDQLEVKPPDRLVARPLVPLPVMIGKLHAAQDARRFDETLISARTDAASSLGFDEALRRAEAYARAGADLLFVEGVTGADQHAMLVEALGHERPLICNVLAPDPGVLLQRQTAGYALALVPDLAPRAAAASIAHAFETLAHTGAATVAMSRAELDDAIGGPAFRARAADYAN